MLYKGFFDEVCTPELQSSLPPACIIHVDCDLYSPAKTVLNFMKPFMQQGTIVLFDDFYCYQGNPAKGEATALAEFFEENPEDSLLDWFNYHCVGKAFIVHLS